MAEELRLTTVFDNEGVDDSLRGLKRFRDAIKQSERDTANITNATEKWDAAFQRLARTNAFDNVSQELAEAVRDANSFEDALARVEDRLGDVRRAQLSQANKSFDVLSRDVGLAGDVQSNLGAIAALTGSREIGVVGEIAALTEELPRLKTAAQGLPQVFTVAASTIGVGGVGLVGALAGLAIGVKIATDAFADAQNQLEAVADARIEAASKVATLTSAEADAEIERLEALQKGQEAAIAAAEADRNRTVQILNQQGILGDFFQLIGGVAGPISDAENRLQDAKTALSETEVELNALTDALKDGALASNDYATELERRKNADQDFLSQLVDNEIRVKTQLESLTADQAEARLDTLNSEIALIDEYKELGGLSEEAAQALNDRQRLLKNERNLIQEALPDLQATADAREREADAAGRAKFLLREATKAREEEVKRLERVKELNEEVADLNAGLDEKITQINADLNDKLAKAEETRADARIEADLKANDDRAEAQRKYNLDYAKEEERHAKELQRIQRQLQLDENRAIQDRNAIALDAAQETAKEQRAAENERNEERLAELDDNLKEQNRLIDKRLAEQNRLAQKRYEQQIRDAQQAAVASINLERQRIQAEIQQKLQEKNALLGIEQQAGQNELSLRAQRNAALLQLEQQFINGQLNLYRQRNAQTSSSTNVPRIDTDPTSNPSPFGRSIPIFHSGLDAGAMPHDGFAYLKRGEYVVNPALGQSANTINLNIAGAQVGEIKATSRQQALETFERVLDSMGVA